MNKPKIRFSGYTEAWEQRKLSELLEVTSEKNTKGQFTQDDILACSLGTELDKKTIFFGLRSTEESVKSYRVVNIGDVIYTKSPIKGYPNGIPCNKQTAEAWGMNEGDLFKCNSYLQIKNVDGSHSMWAPSVNDCLAEDWIVVE